MILVFQGDYSDRVINGLASAGIDALPVARVADPTDIDDLRLFFLCPQWTFGLWRGLQPKNPQHLVRMLPLADEDGSIQHLALDGTEYAEAAPSPIYKNLPGEPDRKLVGFKRFPWKRTSTKDPHPGRTRRAQKRDEGFEEVLA